ncbi:polyphosphate kinase 2 family protein [Arthrobacter sp. MWB30]|nr:polyphosphate kinase 2 family protein [Arthrobacter sp. MWB30]
MTDANPLATSLDNWWVRDNLRETIDHLVELGYTSAEAKGKTPSSSIPADRPWKHGATNTPTRIG